MESPLLQGPRKINLCGTRGPNKPQLEAPPPALRPISPPREGPAETPAQNTSSAATLTTSLHLHPQAHFSFLVSIGEGWFGFFFFFIKNVQACFKPRFPSKRVGGHSQTSQTTKTHSSISFQPVSIVFFPDELLKCVCTCECVSVCANVRVFSSLKKRMNRKKASE